MSKEIENSNTNGVHTSSISNFPIFDEKLNEDEIKTTEDIKDKDMVRVIWVYNTSCDYPYIFLRDNCQCSSCVHPTSKQRLLDTVEVVDIDIKVAKIQHNKQNNTVVLTWPDKHQSIFTGKWLKDKRFPASPENSTCSSLCGIQRTSWFASEMRKALPFSKYDELNSSNDALLVFFENLFKYGLAIITGAPTEPGVLRELSKRVSYSYLKPTIFGDTFTVRSKPSPSDIAYTSGRLALHVDQPSYAYQPEVQFLHCIEQSEGEGAGTSLLTDGIRAVYELKEKDPVSFELLTKIKFIFRHQGDDLFGRFNVQNERPIIQLDSFGNIESLGLSNQSRLPLTNIPSEMIKEYYKAYYAFVETINDDILEYQMKPGDIICFDNKRVLHGRAAFDSTTTSRWLEGCYMDYDELKSKYRVLKEDSSR